MWRRAAVFCLIFKGAVDLYTSCEPEGTYMEGYARENLANFPLSGSYFALQHQIPASASSYFSGATGTLRKWRNWRKNLLYALYITLCTLVCYLWRNVRTLRWEKLLFLLKLQPIAHYFRIFWCEIIYNEILRTNKHLFSLYLVYY